MKPRIKYLYAFAILFMIAALYAGREYLQVKNKPDTTSIGSYVGKFLSILSGKAIYEWSVGETVKMRSKSSPVKLENIPAASQNLLKLKGNFELFSKEVSPNYVSYRVIVNYKQVLYKEGFCNNNNVLTIDEAIPFEHPQEGIANITIGVVGIGGNGKWLNDGEVLISKDFKIEVE
jgi:hypothetical protein